MVRFISDWQCRHLLTFNTGIIPNACEQAILFVTTVSILVTICRTSTTFLFFLRVRAIFYEQRLIIIAFFFSWLVVTGSYFVLMISTNVVATASSDTCLITAPFRFLTKTSSILVASVLADLTPLVYDSCIFFAISYRIIQVNLFEDATFRGKLKVLCQIGRLPLISRALLQGGQLYYL